MGKNQQEPFKHFEISVEPFFPDVRENYATKNKFNTPYGQ